MQGTGFVDRKGISIRFGDIVMFDFRNHPSQRLRELPSGIRARVVRISGKQGWAARIDTCDFHGWVYHDDFEDRVCDDVIVYCRPKKRGV